MISNLIKFLEENFPNGIQMFDTKNTAGDYMYRVFHDGDIIVDYAPDYMYIEIFGLTPQQFQAVENLFSDDLYDSIDSLMDLPNLPEVE